MSNVYQALLKHKPPQLLTKKEILDLYPILETANMLDLYPEAKLFVRRLNQLLGQRTKQKPRTQGGKEQ